MPNNGVGDFCFGDDQCATGLTCWCGTCQNTVNPDRDNIACEVQGFEYDYVHQKCTTTPSTIDCRISGMANSQSNTQSNPTQSKTPWGWIIGGTLGVLAVGGGVWWLMSGKSSSI